MQNIYHSNIWEGLPALCKVGVNKNGLCGCKVFTYFVDLFKHINDTFW